MRYRLFTLLSIIVFVSGCKKNKEASVCRTTTIMHPGIDTLMLTYDEQNRITDYNYYGLVDVQIIYSGITATSTTTPYNDTVRPFVKLYLNSDGNIESMTLGTLYGSTGDYDTYSMKYDNDGHMVRCEASYTDNVHHTTDYLIDSIVYENGNMTGKYVLRKYHPATQYTLFEYTTYTYTNDLNKSGYFSARFENVPIEFGGDAQYLYPLLGKSSQNLPAVTSIYNSLGTLDYEVDYSILLNADGYPQEENAYISATPPYTEHLSFEYSCN